MRARDCCADRIFIRVLLLLLLLMGGTARCVG